MDLLTSTQTGKPQIWRMEPTGEAKVQITRNGGYNAYDQMAERTCIMRKQRAESGMFRRGAAMRSNYGPELTPLSVNCAPAKRGLYCIENANDRATVSFLDLKTRSRRVLVVVPGPIINGLAASADERWLLYTKADFTGSELMLVENFR